MIIDPEQLLSMIQSRPEQVSSVDEVNDIDDIETLLN
jgi:hypothetical protein